MPTLRPIIFIGFDNQGGELPPKAKTLTLKKGKTMNIIEKIKKERMGFITHEEELTEIVKEDRFAKILVRCGNGRFIAPAQDVSHFVEIINNSDTDHVRDISFLAS